MTTLQKLQQLIHDRYTGRVSPVAMQPCVTFPWIKLTNGYEVSIQASALHCCQPRQDFAPSYDTVEFCLDFELPYLPELAPYSREVNYCQELYENIPLTVVAEAIDKLGGLAEAP